MLASRRWAIGFATFAAASAVFVYVLEDALRLKPAWDDHASIRLGWLVALVAFLGVTWGPRVRRGWRVAAVALLAVVALAAINRESVYRIRHIGTDHQLNAWRSFHYYLGSKYFPELGHRWLYEESLKADWQGDRRFRGIQRYRRMEDYKFLPTRRVRDEPRLPGWTDERWDAFKADVRTMSELRSPAFWEGPLMDRGYNPPPAWTAMGGLFTRALSLQSRTQQTLMFGLDFVLLAVAFAVSVWSFGASRSLLVIAALFLWYGSRKAIFGGIWFQDWFTATWLAASFAHRGRLVWAGACVAYAASVRVFPLALCFGPGLFFLRGLLETRRPDPKALRFFGGLAIGLVAMFAVAVAFNGRGLAAFGEFGESILLHADHHRFGERRVGLGHLFMIDWSTPLSPVFDVGERRQVFAAQSVPYHAAQLLFLGVLSFAIWRTRSFVEALLLGAGVIFVGTISSRYYASIYGLLALVGAGVARQTTADSGDPDRRDLVADAWRIGGFALLVFLVKLVEVRSDARQVYLFGNGLLFVWWIGIALLTAARPRRAQPARVPDDVGGSTPPDIPAPA